VIESLYNAVHWLFRWTSVAGVCTWLILLSSSAYNVATSVFCLRSSAFLFLERNETSLLKGTVMLSLDKLAKSTSLLMMAKGLAAFCLSAPQQQLFKLQIYHKGNESHTQTEHYHEQRPVTV
jgi:hypothetical protein